MSLDPQDNFFEKMVYLEQFLQHLTINFGENLLGFSKFQPVWSEIRRNLIFSLKGKRSFSDGTNCMVKQYKDHFLEKIRTWEED